jgi:2-polyprenyl-6-methoxyphenol hydroxylase-like FAD-dependent oxidoreductase
MEIAIIGGGIVGLVTALSLHRAGFRPIVYEAVATPAPLGVGINLLPHAVRELAELGLLDDLLRIGVAITDLHYTTSDGQRVWHEPRGLSAGYHWPQIAIHRGDLQMFLLQTVNSRLGPDSVRLDHKLVELNREGARPRARFADSDGADLGVVEADLLVGADGIHSAVRQHFYPGEGGPRWNGITLWRSTSPIELPLGPAMLWSGWSGQKFVAYPIGPDPLTGRPRLNWICDVKRGEEGAQPPRDWNRRGDPADFAPLFANWRWDGVDVPAVITAAGPIYEFPMVDRDPLPRWTFGHVTLAGDAAHPMYPIGSNGATQGIIDARTLAFFLARAPTIAHALSLYEGARRPATSQIVLMNRAQGPDKVLDVARDRLVGTEATLDALLPYAERAAIASEYKAVAGFDPSILNQRASLNP